MSNKITLTFSESDMVKIRYALIEYATGKTKAATAWAESGAPEIVESYTRQAKEVIELLDRIEGEYLK